MVKLITDRLVIRDPILDDLQNHHELNSNVIINKYTLQKKPKSIEESKQNLLAAIEETQKKDRILYTLIIENKVSNVFIGEIGYKVLQNTPYGKFINLGFCIKEEYWNNGYTTEALKQLIKFAFEENDVYRISMGGIEENIGFIRVMEKCGIKREAYFKEYFFHNEKIEDWVEYGLLKKDWN